MIAMMAMMARMAMMAMTAAMAIMAMAMRTATRVITATIIGQWQCLRFTP